jgi:GTP cyclohydrolase IA
MENRGKLKLIKSAGSIELTESEKLQIIQNATVKYEEFLDALLIDWRNDPNADNTPKRVAKSLVRDLISGCYSKPPEITAFPSDGYDGIIAQCNIPVKSLCSHHHLPFTGIAHVAYIPEKKNGRVIGLSKLNRIVEYYARRPQIQEGLTIQIHDALMAACENNCGVAVILECTHTCACLRGVKHDGCVMKTSKLSGDFMSDSATRQEFYELLRN